MKKIHLLVSLISFIFFSAQDSAFNKLYGNGDPNNYYLGHYPVVGSDGLNIKWYGGIRLITNTDDSVIQMLGNGNVGIGNNSPTEKLDVSGNLVLRNITNATGAGSSIYFASYAPDSPGARIKSSLEYASGVESRSSLILSSYWTKYMNEMTLKDGKVGIGTENPQSNLHLMIPASSNLIDGMTIDVQSFGTPANEKQSNFFKVRDIGASVTSFIIKGDGSVGIGTDSPAYKLHVNGNGAFNGNLLVNAKIEANEIKVTNTPTADFVFAKDYELPNLEKVEKYLLENNHLPEIASAKEMEKEGLNLGEFQIKLLQKIEELTLYQIDLNKRMKSLEQENKSLKKIKK